MEGLCFLSPMLDKASFSVISNASTEYSPLSLGSANSEILPRLAKSLAYKSKVINGVHQSSLRSI